MNGFSLHIEPPRMQHDHVLKKINFDLLNPYPGSVRGEGLRAKYLLPCCCIRDSL